MLCTHSKHSVAHLPREVVLGNLPKLVERDRATLVEILAHIAEVDVQKHYIAAAYASTVAYCMGELRMNEDAALKRIRAARAGHEFPAIFDAMAEGRLTLTVVVLLKKHLTSETAEALLAAADGKSKAEVELFIARLRNRSFRRWRPSPRASSRKWFRNHLRLHLLPRTLTRGWFRNHLPLRLSPRTPKLRQFRTHSL